MVEAAGVHLPLLLGPQNGTGSEDRTPLCLLVGEVRATSVLTRREIGTTARDVFAQRPYADRAVRRRDDP
jgi:hypothetical protein